MVCWGLSRSILELQPAAGLILAQGEAGTLMGSLPPAGVGKRRNRGHPQPCHEGHAWENLLHVPSGAGWGGRNGTIPCVWRQPSSAPEYFARLRAVDFVRDSTVFTEKFPGTLAESACGVLNYLLFNWAHTK